jgi:hypothetical protein
LDADSISSFLRNRTSGSLVYLLSLVQPLTLREIQGHPLRLQYVRLMTGREQGPKSLKGAVRRGVDCGLLIALTTKREHYYFLNSDVGVAPPGIDEEEGGARVALEEGPSEVHRDVSVPPARSLTKEHPIPIVRDPSTFLGWFEWLSDPHRRDVIRALQDSGPLTRKELSEKGVRVDLPLLRGGVRTGVLRIRSDRMDFQFRGMRIPPKGRPWTARPPMFWLSRSFEPLRCIQGAEAYLRDPAGQSPMSLLQEMSEDGRKVVPSRRRRGLSVNLLYEPTALLPRIENLGPGAMPGVWWNRGRMISVVDEGYERATAALYLEEELRMTSEKRTEWRATALRSLARRRLEAYFEDRERELRKRFQEGERAGYGLGPGAIMSVASVELERERLQEERKHFERFMEVIGA